MRAAVAGWWGSRYGARFVAEVGVIVAFLLLYRLGRMLGRHESARAFDNAHQVLGLEDRLGIDTELSMQRAMLGHLGLIRLLNRYYASVHFGRRWSSSFSSMCGDRSCGPTSGSSSSPSRGRR